MKQTSSYTGAFSNEMLLSGFQPAADCTIGLVKKMLITISYSSEHLLGTSSYHEECYSIFLSNGIIIHKGNAPGKVGFFILFFFFYAQIDGGSKLRP